MRDGLAVSALELLDCDIVHHRASGRLYTNRDADTACSPGQPGEPSSWTSRQVRMFYQSGKPIASQPGIASFRCAMRLPARPGQINQILALEPAALMVLPVTDRPASLRDSISIGGLMSQPASQRDAIEFRANYCHLLSIDTITSSSGQPQPAGRRH